MKIEEINDLGDAFEVVIKEGKTHTFPKSNKWLEEVEGIPRWKKNLQEKYKSKKSKVSMDELKKHEGDKI